MSVRQRGDVLRVVHNGHRVRARARVRGCARTRTPVPVRESLVQEPDPKR